MISTALQKLYRQFPALQHRNYRLYFYGQLVSFTGSWLQSVAFGWLTYNITHSAFWLGATTAVSSLPVLLLSLYGGLLVDRLNRKNLLVVTQTASLILAAILGFLTIFHLINLPLLLLITFLSGIANAIDNPTTNAFVVDIVKKEDLPSAIGLNSTMFNTGRVLGPAVAGFLIAMVGIGNIFLINAASFLAILVSLYFIKSEEKPAQKQENPIKAIKEGIHYSFTHPRISVLLITAAMGAIFCFSQATILPILVTHIFREGSQALGTLLSAMGFGALCGSLLISSKSKKIKASTFMTTGCIAFIIATFFFSFTTNLYLAALFLFASTFGLTIQFSSTYATIQRHVKEEFRGRVSSIYVLLFVGFGSLGNLFIGTASSLIGAEHTIRICTLIIAFYALGVYLFVGSPKTKHRQAIIIQRLKPSFAFVRK